MKYDLKNHIDLDRFLKRVDKLIQSKKLVDLTESKPPKSGQQNAYLHLILSWFSVEYGETLDYVKSEFFKRRVNPGIFVTQYVNQKTGEEREDLRSVSDLDSGELTEAIDRFRNWASKEAGTYLPLPNEQEYLRQIMVEIERQKQYL